MHNAPFSLCLACLLLASFSRAEEHAVTSPSGRIDARIDVGDAIRISISLNDRLILEPSLVGMNLDGGRSLGASARVANVSTTRTDNAVEQVITRKQSELRERYNGLILVFEDGYSLEARAYDDGVAYRFASEFDGVVEVIDETVALQFPSGTNSFFPEEESMISHNERLYPYVDLEELDERRFCSLPVMMDVPEVGKLLFTEADLFDYPAMYLEGGDGASLSSRFPRYVLESKPTLIGPDRNVEIVKEADYIAKTEGSRTFPWRVFVVGEDDMVFLESELVYLLSRPLEIEDPSWIKPGRVAWDWYNANNIYGVDFESGINNDTYKFYIDFASRYGIEYVILDEGWSKTTLNLFEPNPDIDVVELVEYGAVKGVKIILWSLWKPMEESAPELLELYKNWGVAGVKIDFMQRSDQYMVQFYERIAREAAKHKLIVDYHGSFKPAGLRRALPNIISYEGVKGAENNKWSADITPEHNVTIPFIRMVAGPMDYTPGALSNANPRSFAINHFRPMSLGTRAHVVAKYVVFESALQMLCDAPSRYLKEKETVEYIVRIPSIWDETKALAGEVGDYVAIARRKGSVWYVGAMTGQNARKLAIELSFLPKGEYMAEIFQDGANAKHFAEDYKRTETTVTPGDTLVADMAPGGGWTAIFTAN